MSKADPSETASMEKKNERELKKKKRWPLLAAIVATILILSGFAYWYVTNVPDLESFMDDSYSDGEKAKFKAKVTEMELLETSYGEATLVYFDDFSHSFCFLGNHTGKYKVGKTIVVEVTFKRYNIDGLEFVVPEEMILGFFLQLEPVFLGVSHFNGLGLTGNVNNDSPGYYYVNISNLMYPLKTYPLDLYDHALNGIYGYYQTEDGTEIGLGTIDREYKYSKKGSFGMDFSLFTIRIYLNSISRCDSEFDCAYLKNDESYLPGRIHFMDKDNDGNISLGDSYQIDIEPTESRFHLNFYMFNIRGITAGTNFFLNWYNGPLYSLGRYMYYSFGPAYEELSNGKYSIQMAVHETSSGNYPLRDIRAYIAESGYAPKQIYEGDLVDSINVTLGLSHLRSNSPLFDVEISFYDTNGNGLLDGGDFFFFENMIKDTSFEFMMKGPEGDLITRWQYLVSQGTSVSDYTLITMGNPVRLKENTSINVIGVEAGFSKIDRLDYFLHIPGNTLHIDMGAREKEIFSDSGNVRFFINDTDENGYLTKGDRVEIEGLKSGEKFSVAIHRDDFPLYELEAVA